MGDKTKYGNEAVGSRIRELRQKKNLTHEALAEKIGISRDLITKIENGKRDLRSDVAVDIADALDTTCDYLLRGIAPENLDTAKDLGLSNDAINVLRAIADETGQKEENRQVYELLKSAGVQVRESIPEPRSGFYLSENLRVIRVLNELLTAEKGLQVLRDIYVILFCAFRDAIIQDDTEGIGGLSSSVVEPNKRIHNFKEIDFSVFDGADMGSPAARITKEDLTSVLLLNLNTILKNWRDEIQNAKKDEKPRRTRRRQHSPAPGRTLGGALYARRGPRNGQAAPQERLCAYAGGMPQEAARGHGGRRKRHVFRTGKDYGCRVV